MSLDSINADFEKSRGKSGGYPSGMRYVVENRDGTLELHIEDSGTDCTIWKIADPWGFAAFDHVRNAFSVPQRLRFALHTPSEQEKPKSEAFKRRLSYLANINKLSIVLTLDGQEERLYTMSELAKRPDDEVVRTDFAKRGDDDTPGRLEKDFQAYLFGKGLYDGNEAEMRTNERLALFGKDFTGISKKNVGVEREFPTGVFTEEVKRNTRVLPTEYIDLVTINKSNEIAIIELKFDDSKLEVIAQLLNYALFFHSYMAQLTPLLDKRLHCSSAGSPIKAYLVSNVFHQKFDAVWPYYSHNGHNFIAMRQVWMGYMPSGHVIDK